MHRLGLLHVCEETREGVGRRTQKGCKRLKLRHRLNRMLLRMLRILLRQPRLFLSVVWLLPFCYVTFLLGVQQHRDGEETNGQVLHARAEGHTATLREESGIDTAVTIAIRK